MHYSVATVAILFVTLSNCLPGPLLAPPTTLESSKGTDLLLPCNNDFQLNGFPSASNSTTSLCASGPRDWNAWQKIRVLSGRRGTYSFRAHPVKAGYLYEFNIQTSRKIETLDFIFQNAALEQHYQREGVMITHTRFGPFTMPCSQDGWLFVTLHFRQSILPFWGKTRTIEKGGTVPPQTPQSTDS